MTTPIQPQRSTGGHRQYLTVLFSDLKGSTLLGRQLEVERFAELLEMVRRAWHAAAKNHDGLVLRIQGDGALIVFGYPQSGEDDGRRAVDSALEIHAAVRRIGDEYLAREGRLSVRTGIHAGVLLLAEGDLERGRLDLSGDVANVAAHLQRDAPDDGIVVSLDALGPHANLFELLPDPRPAPDHIQAVQVRARGKAERRFDAMAQRGPTPFIGREAVIAALEGHLGLERMTRPRCAVVQAGPGMGKTRLLEEFLQHRLPVGWQVLRGNCDPPSRSEPLQPFAQVLRAQQLVVDADTALASLLGVCARAPTLLVIDDWQWADDASRQLLVALLRDPSGPRVLLAARSRDDGAQWIADAAHLTLSSFDESQTERTVRRWLPDADPFLAARIHEYAGGVPLYVEELCHSAAVESLWQQLENRHGATGWLSALVASRLARLEPRHAGVVRAAAVVGNVVPLDLLRGVCDTVVDDEAVALLADADFLYPDETGQCLSFKHGITRDAVYDSIGLYERTALHQRAQTTLLVRMTESPGKMADANEALAYHARGSGHWEVAATFAERAGDKASQVFAMDSARQQYRAALEAVEHLPRHGPEVDARWCELCAKLGATCVFDPLSLADGLAVFERAVEVARRLGDAGLVARAQYWLGYLLYAVGRFPEAAMQLRPALAAARDAGYLRLAAQLEATLGQILAGACEYRPALELMDRALDSKVKTRRPSGGFAMGSAYTLACKGGIHADQGDFAAAFGAFAGALDLLGDSTHPVRNSTLNWIAITSIWQGRWDEAQRVATDSVGIATGTRVLLLLSVSRAVLGYARWCAGDDAGLDELRESVRWMASRHCVFYASLFHGWLIEALAAEDARTVGVAAGERRAELGSSARIVMQRSRGGERIGEAAACRALALIASREGRTGMAARWLRRAEQSARLRESSREAALNALVDALLTAREPAAIHDRSASRRDAALAQAARQIRDLGIVALPRLYAGFLPNAAS